MRYFRHRHTVIFRYISVIIGKDTLCKISVEKQKKIMSSKYKRKFLFVTKLSVQCTYRKSSYQWIFFPTYRQFLEHTQVFWQFLFSEFFCMYWNVSHHHTCFDVSTDLFCSQQNFYSLFKTNKIRVIRKFNVVRKF